MWKKQPINGSQESHMYLHIWFDKSQEWLNDATLDTEVPALWPISSNVAQCPDSLVYDILMLTG